ncbi:MAG: helix-turn-helix protein [Firmicutes bacterium]|nr:helix-turn-helix protein [Bacillota bacterium]
MTIQTLENPLAEAMKKSGLTQREIAAKIGVTEQAVSGWKSLRRRPRPEQAFELAALLSIDVKIVLRKRVSNGA